MPGPTRVLTVAAARPGAYPTIGSALLEAPDGAVVAIAAGTYPETLEFSFRSITLRQPPLPHRLACSGVGWRGFGRLAPNEAAIGRRTRHRTRADPAWRPVGLAG
jgi:hypothetical protein